MPSTTCGGDEETGAITELPTVEDGSVDETAEGLE
jgi:hypothetical protein